MSCAPTVLTISDDSSMLSIDDECEREIIYIGEPGPPGPKGDPGALGGDAFYTHVQGTPASVWNVTHNLGKKPAVTVVDSTDRVVEGQKDYVDSNNLTLTFVGAFSGKAYMS